MRKALIALVTLALSVLVPAAVSAGVNVRVAPEATVQGNEIALGDVATVQGDEALARRLRKLIIGPAPLPGSSQRLDPGYLRLRLGEAQLEPSKVNLVIPDEVLVTRAFQVLTGAAMVEAASREVRQRLEAQPGARGPWAVVAASRPADLRVPAGSVELVAQVQGDPSTQSSLGPPSPSRSTGGHSRRCRSVSAWAAIKTWSWPRGPWIRGRRSRPVISASRPGPRPTSPRARSRAFLI